MKRYSVTLHGHRTLCLLEKEFWVVLKQAKQNRRGHLSALIQNIDDERLNVGLPSGLSSALRIYLLQYLQNQKIRFSFVSITARMTKTNASFV